MNVMIERADTSEAAFRDVFSLLVALHKEGGYAPLDVETAAENCYRTMAEGMTFVARVDGEAVGTLALTELVFWYSKQTFLQDAWLFVKPEHRNRTVGVELMKAARAEADARNQIAFVTLNNPDRRQKRTRASLEAQVAGYVPLGYTIKVR